MSKEDIEYLFSQGGDLLKQATITGIDEAQLTLIKSLEIGTRFGENHITQNSLTNTTKLSLTLVKNQKIGKISVNLPQPDQYHTLIDDALTIMNFAESDPDFPGFVSSSSVGSAFQQFTSDYDVEKVADKVHTIINNAKGYDQTIKTVAGNINTFNTSQVLMNSHGVELWEVTSRASSVMNISAKVTGSEYESRSTLKLTGKDLSSLKLEENTNLCAERAKRGLHPSSIEIGSYPTIFSPTAISELIFFIGMATSAESLVTHTSFLRDKMGEQVFDKSLTIIDERNNPEHFFSGAFDSDGVATKPITFIDQGILKNYAYNRRLAKKLIQAESNGRNLAGFGGELPFFASQTITPGSSSEDELIKSIDNGVYVVNLFYNNFVNPPQGLCTGLTRDGLFKIENGEIVGSLKNMRWTDKMESIFKSIQVGNNPTQVGGFFFGSTIAPSIMTDKFTFSSAGKH